MRYLLLLVLLSTQAIASEPFEIKGVKLGATEAEVLEKNPDIKRCENAAKAGARSALADRECSIWRNLHKDDVAVFAGFPASISFKLINEQVGYVSVHLDSVHFNEVVAALKSKYGEPSSNKTEVVTNRMGAKFENNIVEWRQGASVIRAYKIASRINNSSVMLFTESYFKDVERRQAEIAAERAKSL